MDDIGNQYEENELIELFARLLPRGFAGDDVRRDVAPGGWATSPLIALFHPSVAQCHEEALRMHRNMEMLRREDDARPPSPEPTLAEFAAEDEESPIEADEEISRLVGMCLWDIFSDGHDVIDADGRELSLGSFRASGGFLADRLNEQVHAGLVKGPVVDAATRSAAVAEQMRRLMPDSGSDLLFKMLQEEQTGPYDYLDFYLGSAAIAGRADLTPVYRMIFTRLKALDLDWKYTFPRLHLIDFRPLGEALKAQQVEEAGEPEWLNYSPEDELAKDEENRQKDQEIAAFRETLDDGYREAATEALTQPPPLVVRVYAAVYGHWPTGWPPTADA